MSNQAVLQGEIVKAVDRALATHIKKSLIYMPIGMGKSFIITQIVHHLCVTQGYVCAIIVDRQIIKEQYLQMCERLDISEGYLHVMTVEDWLGDNSRQRADVVFIDECHSIPVGLQIEHFSCAFIAFSSTRVWEAGHPFFDAKVIYTAKMDSIYFDEGFVIEGLLFPLLSKLGFRDCGGEVPGINGSFVERPDILVDYDNNRYCVEVKIYRSPRAEVSHIDKTVRRIKFYQNLLRDTGKTTRGMGILFCEVNEEMKQAVLCSDDVLIWDIKNLLYMCQGDEQLLSMLWQVTPYSIDLVSPVKPLEFGVSDEVPPPVPSPVQLSLEKKLIERLSNCPTGKSKRADKEYEAVCADIVSHLFGGDFSRCIEQFSTRNRMFRIDMLCALKDSRALWSFLSRYYRTRFVVFEFKNYAEKLDQNLIYVTEKYLYEPALRNVAFIISRQGFHENAETAAYGILKEHGKLIIDVPDSELITMLKMKESGEEPSDHLLGLIETFLMEIEK